MSPTKRKAIEDDHEINEDTVSTNAELPCL